MKRLRHVAMRSMLEFQCLGEKCEDTCCGGWTVGLGQGDYARLKKTLDKDARQGQPLGPSNLLIQVHPSERTRALFGIIRQTSDERCLLLDERQLCSLHARHGAAALPSVCASFPRVRCQVGDRLELTGTLACPEVARRTLLTDGATDFCETPAAANPAIWPALHESDQVAVDPAQVRHLDEIRGTLYQLFSLSTYPTRSLMLFASWLAQETDHFFSPADGHFDTAAFESEVAELTSETQLEILHTGLPASSAQRTDATPLVLAVIEALTRSGCKPQFRQYVEEIHASFTLPRNLTTIAEQYAVRRRQVMSASGDVIDLYLRNYCRHFVLKNWYPGAGTLKRYVHGLLWRVAAMRFLILAHPETLAAVEAGDRDRLDRLAVRAFYSLARNIEHNGVLLGAVLALLDRSLVTFDAVVALLSF